MKRSRDPVPDLASVLVDSDRHVRVPLPLLHVARNTPVGEKRTHNRFDKAFPVMIGSELYGDTVAIARNVSAGGILVEMTYAPPLGTLVTVHFQHARGDDLLDELVARAEVKHHHYLNFTGSGEAAGARAIGMRFVEFVDAGELVASDRLH